MGFRQNSRRKRRNKQPKSQVEYKFAVDERVLCYEPDLKKARVLYDSKVLEVVERKNHGKTNVEYKIHFFGWNSSWDRYVDEDCVLKDTDENRALQKQLKESADELLQTHLKKRKRKKTLSELLKEATKGGKNVNPSHSKTKTDEESSRSHSSSDSSDQESSDDDDDDGEISRIILTNHMRAILERDFHNITVKKMLVRVPVDISVVCIFEAYVKDLGFRELRNVLDQREAFLKSNNTQPLPPALSASLAQASASAGAKFPAGKVQPKFLIEPWLEEINRIYRKVRQAQEIIYGLKTIFDYMLYLMLLYNVENEQYEESKTMRPKVPLVNSSLIIPNLPSHVQPIQTPFRSDRQEPHASSSRKSEKTEGRRKVADPVGTTKAFADMFPTPTAPTRSQSKALQPQNAEKLINDAALWQRKVDRFIRDLNSWRMLPEECFQQEEPDPCMLYGLIHLLRLFVKLPDILNRMLIPRRKVRIIAHHVNQMIEHIEACYVFSTKELYVTIVKSAYAEDQMRVDAAKSDEEGPDVKVEVDTDKSMYSTQNHRLTTNLKTNPPLAKVVEVPLSNTDGGVEEHQLTVSMDTSLPLPIPVDDAEEGTSPPAEPNKDLTVEVEIINVDDIKLEPTSPPVERPSSIQQPKKTESVKKSASRKLPTLPLLTKHRQMRESAANAAVKNAHIFASQQNFSSRSSFSSTVIKKEPKDKEAASLKRKLPDGAHSSPSKRITRTCSKSTSNDNSTDKLITPVRKSEDRKDVSPNQLIKDVPRSSPDRSSKVKVDNNDLKKRTSSRTSSSEGKPLPKRTSSTPRSETGSPHKEMGSASGARSPHKLTPSYSTSIRLRSKSGERQLRSKGSLVNAFSLPMQTSPRSSKSGPDKSPKRRESAGNRESCNQQQQRSVSPKHSEPARSLRSRR